MIFAPSSSIIMGVAPDDFATVNEIVFLFSFHKETEKYATPIKRHTIGKASNIIPIMFSHTLSLKSLHYTTRLK